MAVGAVTMTLDCAPLAAARVARALAASNEAAPFAKAFRRGEHRPHAAFIQVRGMRDSCQKQQHTWAKKMAATTSATANSLEAFRRGEHRPQPHSVRIRRGSASVKSDSIVFRVAPLEWKAFTNKWPPRFPAAAIHGGTTRWGNLQSAWHCGLFEPRTAAVNSDSLLERARTNSSHPSRAPFDLLAGQGGFRLPRGDHSLGRSDENVGASACHCAHQGRGNE
jgi:hypothetical protein